MIRTDESIFLGQRLYHFRPDPNKLDARFLLYALMAPDLQGQIQAFGSGATVEHMRLADIPELEITVPPICDQHRIAGILSAYDELIENNQRRIMILEEMARSLYREWFVNFRFPGHEKVPLVACAVGYIPEGWDVSSYDKAAYFENGDRGKNYPNVSEFVDQGVPFINAGHLAEGSVDAARVNRITEEKFEQLRSGKIRDGDLLFCLRGSPGRTARVARLRYGAIASSLVIIRPTARANKEFLYYTLSSEIGRQMVTELDNGAAQPNISVSSLQKYPLVLPSKGVLNQFAILVEQNWKLSETLREQVSVLVAQRDLLLPRLLSGRVGLPKPEAA